MNTNIEFDEIFALRVLLQDEYENENDIIREIKYELLSRGMLEENIPAFIQEFYEKFGINISLEQINEALVSPNQGLETHLYNFVNTLLQHQMNNQGNHIHPESDSEDDLDDEEDEDNDEEDNEDEQDNNENVDISNNPQSALQQLVVTMTSGPTGTSYQVISSNLNAGLNGPAPEVVSQVSNNAPSVIGTNPSLGHVTNNLPPGSPALAPPAQPAIGGLENLLNSLLHLNGPQMQLPPIHPMMLQPLLPPLSVQFQNMTPLNILGGGPLGMQDVRTTLDEDDTNNLKKHKLETKLEEKCSICMTDMDVGEEACELPCNHNFHSDCIDPWLKQYNYKCPICRKEAGKPKYNV